MGTPIRSEPAAPTQDTQPTVDKLGTPGGIAPAAQDNPQPTSAYKNTGPVITSDQPEIRQGVLQKQAPVQSASALTPEERAARKARIATVLDRGIVQDRLNVPLPAGIYGEWVRADPLEVQRMRTLGFEIDKEHAPAHALHDEATGGARVADVIFMTTSRDNKELIDEVRNEQMMRMHAPKRAKEETELESSVRQSTDGIIPTFIESETHTARLADVAAAVAAADAQVQPIE